MIKVVNVCCITDLCLMEMPEPDGRKLYMIFWRSKDVFRDSFSEYIAPKNVPKINQKFTDLEELKRYCRGKRSE